MFGFKLWGRFAAFRDPLTITQNLTFPIPPKTTIGGLLAAILGIDYNDYFTDEDFFQFQYSVVLLKPIRKKNFSQNYIADYTKKSANKFDIMKSYFDAKANLQELYDTKYNILNYKTLSKSDQKKLLGLDNKIEMLQKNLPEKSEKYHLIMGTSFPKPKPIFRELLIEPEYLIFILNFKHKDTIIDLLKNHCSSYNLYLGNTEFSANYKNTPCDPEEKSLIKLNSFTAQPEKIKFEPGKKYTNVYAATKVINKREYRDYKRLIICDREISLKNEINGYVIKTEQRDYNCEFI